MTVPTAEDYETAAAMFQAAALTSQELVRPADAVMGVGVMVGGQLTDMVTSELEAADALLHQVAGELTELATLCRERAEISRQALAEGEAYRVLYAEYERDLTQWESTGEGRRPEPPTTPPDPPSWLTA